MLIAATVTFILFPEGSNPSRIVYVGCFLMFVVGLIDDFRRVKPYHKLVAQIVAAALLTYGGLSLPWTPWPPLNLALTIFWVVGITNAINLLDNMDGLAAGIAAIACLFLAINFVVEGQYREAVRLVGFAGALVGFLVYNFNPASIFMGDCGSMFVGFFLAASSLLTAEGHAGRSRSLLPVLAVPLLILIIPIFDTTFVTILRKLSGRAASQGGRDHTSHRLVALGLSERNAVLVLYALAVLAGLLALTVRQLQLAESLSAVCVFTVGLSFLGVHLARVKVYDEEEIKAASQRPLVAFLFQLTHRRRIFEVLLDVVLVMLSYHLAYVVVFGPMDTGGDWGTFAESLPLVVMLKLAVFVLLGVYRCIWRYVTIENLVLYAKAVATASATVMIALLLSSRFIGFSRIVLVLDALILFIFIAASRFAFRMLRRFTDATTSHRRRPVLIYGAGDAGELLIRELRNNHELDYVAVALIDDDPYKIGRQVHGLPVLASGELDICLTRMNIAALLVSTSRITPTRLKDAVAACQRVDVPVRMMRVQLRTISKRPSIQGNARVASSQVLRPLVGTIQQGESSTP